MVYLYRKAKAVFKWPKNGLACCSFDHKGPSPAKFGTIFYIKILAFKTDIFR